MLHLAPKLLHRHRWESSCQVQRLSISDVGIKIVLVLLNVAHYFVVVHYILR